MIRGGEIVVAAGSGERPCLRLLVSWEGRHAEDPRITATVASQARVDMRINRKNEGDALRSFRMRDIRVFMTMAREAVNPSRPPVNRNWPARSKLSVTVTMEPMAVRLCDSVATFQTENYFTFKRQ